jgi:transcriptional regulator with XRE-family HTH domain
MSTRHAAGRFKTLSGDEQEICERLAARRRYSGESQQAFAGQIGLTRNQLANIESARVALKFWTGWRVCALLDVNPVWLARGTHPDRPFYDLDLREYKLSIAADALFSEVMNGVLARAFSLVDSAPKGAAFVIPRPEWLADLIRKAQQWETEAARMEDEAAMRRKKVEDTVLHIREALSYYRLHPEDAGGRQTAGLLREAQQYLKEFGVDIGYSNAKSHAVQTGTKSLWKMLQQRLLALTAEKGRKQELAAAMDVTPGAVSQWLSTGVSHTTPIAETTLRLLQWVEQEEAKQKTARSVASTTRGSKRTQRKDNRNEVKTSGPP